MTHDRGLSVRAVIVACLVALGWLAVSTPGHAGSKLLRGDRSCEEECEISRARDDAQCEVAVFRERERSLCHQFVRASRDVCMRICEE